MTELRAFRNVDMGQLRQAELVTCDLFDTLLFRCCAKPSDVFHATALRMMRGGALPQDCDPLAFAAQRIYAENIARSKNPARECSFEDIAREMAKVCDPEALMQHEMQTEMEYCLLNEELTSHLQALHKEGKKIAVISDIYHSVRALSLLLRGAGFPIGILSGIFSSSVEQASKADGRLFTRVSRHFGIPASRWVHIGDNPYADALNFQKIGGTAVFIPQRAYLEEILHREKLVKADDDECASLETMRELAARRAVAVEAELRPYFIAGASVFGPAVSRFGDWCIEQCRRNGVQKALVCTREAETFFPLLKAAARNAASELEILPFYVSRESVCRAFLHPLDAGKLYRLLTAKRQPHSIRQLLAWLKLNPERCAGILGLDDMDTPLPAGSPAVLSLSRALAASEECAALLAGVAQQDRDSFLTYFGGLCGASERVALVDLGFAGTTQEFIEEILRGVASAIRIFGLYFCLNRHAAKHALLGEHASGYLGRIGMQDRETRLMAKHPEILEQTLISTAGSVLGYENGQPALEKVIPLYAQARRTEAARKGIFTFMELWHQFRRKLTAAGSDLTPQAYRSIDARNAVILQRLFLHPLQSEAAAFGALRHDDNFGATTGGMICSDADVSRLAERGYAALAQSRCYWPQGVFHLRDGNAADAAFSYLRDMNT